MRASKCQADEPAQGQDHLASASPKASAFHRFVHFALASFQETTRVLTEAAINGKVDFTCVVSRKTSSWAAWIPAGTGMEYYRGIKIAGEDIEEEMVAEQEAAALDAIPGYDDETRALYTGGLSEKETPTEDTLAEVGPSASGVKAGASDRAAPELAPAVRREAFPPGSRAQRGGCSAAPPLR